LFDGARMTEQRIGNYIIEEPIGRGGMGVVYKGRHAELPRVVAVKSIDPHIRRDLRRLRHRFAREAYVQSQLDHAGIVKIYDYVVSEQTYHIVMEYVEGSSLADLLRRQRGGRLPSERALDFFEQILAALSYAHCFVYRDEEGATHRGMTHRDLKPPNILVTPDGRVKVTDFGIVKLSGSSEETDTSGLVYGSPHYVSPEQARGAHVDPRSDIYSLGVILYEMLTGATPFAGDAAAGKEEKQRRSEVLRAHVEREPPRPSELNPEISPELEALILRALEKNPDARFDTTFDFWRAVRSARGRDTKDIDGLESSLKSAPRERPDTGRIAGVTGEVVRDSFATQPMTQTFCDSCGAEAGGDDSNCRDCGSDLKASPATKSLTRGGRASRRRPLLWAALAVVALTLVGLVVFRAARRDAPADGGAGHAATPPASTTTAPSIAPASSTAPGGGGAAAPPELLAPARVLVDSSFEGYNAQPLTDGVTDVRQVGAARYNVGNWVSSETTAEHWIQIDFARPARVTTVYVFWGFDKGRYMPSRRVELEASDEGGAWRKISELTPGENIDRAAFDFPALETRRLRVVQPAQQGPPNRPFVMWVREVQVFGARLGS
jgi:serine/threonine protein kinase